MSTLNPQSNEDKTIDDQLIAPKEPIYVMTIELDKGKAAYIEVYPDSIPEEVSYDFCRKNNLDYQSLNYLKKQIEELIIQNKTKISNLSSIPKPNHAQIKDNKTKPKDNDVRGQVTPSKNGLFSCESFIVTLQERNINKINKKIKSKKIIQLSKPLQKQDNTNEVKNDQIKMNKHSTQNQTETHRSIVPIPHPQASKSITRLDSNPSIRINHWDSDVCSKISSNYFKESSSRSNSNSKKNIGVILYEKGNQLLEKKEKKIEALRHNLELRTEAELTFKPLIYSSSFSKKKMTNNASNRDNKSAPNEITNRKDSYVNIKQEQLLKKNNSNGDKCPSIAIIKPLPSSCQPYCKSQKKLKVATSKFKDEFSYHPHITNYQLTEQTNLPFSFRQKLFKQKCEENNTKLRDHLTKNIDNITGQPYFKPALVSKQKKRSQSPTNNIFEDLYSYASLYKVNQNERKGIIDKENKMMTKPKISDHSEDIFQKKKETVFKNIFHALDSDEDGLISIYSIDLNRIPINISSIIMPIINDLKEYQGTINCNDFTIEGIKLFEKLNYSKRKELFEMNKRPKEYIFNYTFKPSINKSIKRKSVQQDNNLSYKDTTYSKGENDLLENGRRTYLI